MNKFNWIVLVLILLTNSCTKEKIVTEYVDKEYAWNKDYRVQYEQTILLNSHFADGILYLLGNYNYTKIAITGELPNNSLGGDVVNYPLVFDYPFDCKFPIMDKYYVAASNEFKRLVLVPNDLPNNNLTRKIIPFESIDSSFYEFELNDYSSGISLGINSSNFCLVPFRTQKDDLIDNTPRFLLIKVSSDHQPYEDKMDTLYTKIVDYPKGYDNGPEFVRSISSLESGFIFSGLEKTYKIDTLGNITKAYDGNIMRIVQKGNELFGFTKSKFIQSSDEGLTWKEIGNADFNFSILNYYSIKDTIVGYYNSQIFKIRLSESGINAIELDNEGLEGKTITSITEVADSLIYVTTLNGLYYRNGEDFFTLKE